MDIASFMPGLRSAELGHNHLESLGATARSSPTSAELLSLNLEGNLLDDWIQITDSLRDFTRYDLNVCSSVALTLPQPTTGSSLRQRHSIHPASQLGAVPISGH